MTKEQYKEKLLKKGYVFDGDIAIIDTHYGLWEQKIIEDVFGNFGLVTIKNPLDESKEEA